MTFDFQNVFASYISVCQPASSSSSDLKESLKSLFTCQNIIFNKTFTSEIGFLEIRNRKWITLPVDDVARPALCLHAHVYTKSSMEKSEELNIEVVKRCFQEFVDVYTQYLNHESDNSCQLATMEAILKDIYKIDEEGDEFFPRVRAIVASFSKLSDDLTVALKISYQMISSKIVPNRVNLLRSQIGGKLHFSEPHKPLRMSRSAIQLSESKQIVQSGEVNSRLKRAGSARNVSRWDSSSRRSIIISSSSPELRVPIIDHEKTSLHTLGEHSKPIPDITPADSWACALL